MQLKLEHLKFHGQLRFGIFRGLPDQLLVRRKSLKNVAAIQMQPQNGVSIRSIRYKSLSVISFYLIDGVLGGFTAVGAQWSAVDYPTTPDFRWIQFQYYDVRFNIFNLG